jgi:DNA-binding response OmpR family regulator
MPHTAGSTPRIVLYSDDVDFREEIRLGVGPRLATGRTVEWVEVATGDALVEIAHTQDVDLFILDAEAAKVGGMGLARQLKDEIDDCAPVIVVIARQVDAWLASWSNAEQVLVRPLDPMALHAAVTRLVDPEALSASTAAAAASSAASTWNVG